MACRIPAGEWVGDASVCAGTLRNWVKWHLKASLLHFVNGQPSLLEMGRISFAINRHLSLKGSADVQQLRNDWSREGSMLTCEHKKEYIQPSCVSSSKHVRQSESWHYYQLWWSFGTAVHDAVFINHLTFIPMQMRCEWKGGHRAGGQQFHSFYPDCQDGRPQNIRRPANQSRGPSYPNRGRYQLAPR